MHMHLIQVHRMPFFSLIMIYENKFEKCLCCSLAMQISRVSTHCLTSRTCRRSPSTLLWSMLTLQASKNLPLLSPPGKTNYRKTSEVPS